MTPDKSNHKKLVDQNSKIGSNTKQFYNNLSWRHKYFLDKSRSVSLFSSSLKPIVMSGRLKLTSIKEYENFQSKTQFSDGISDLYFSYPDLINHFLSLISNTAKGTLPYDEKTLSTSISTPTNRKQKNSSFLKPNSYYTLSQGNIDTSILPDDQAYQDTDNTLARPTTNLFQSILTRYLRLPLSMSASPHFTRQDTANTTTPDPNVVSQFSDDQAYQDTDNTLARPTTNLFQSILTRYLRLPLSMSASPHFTRQDTANTTTPDPNVVSQFSDDQAYQDTDNTLARPTTNLFQSILTRYLRLPLSMSTSPHFTRQDIAPTTTPDPNVVSQLSDEQTSRYITTTSKFEQYYQNFLPLISNAFKLFGAKKLQERTLESPNLSRSISSLPSYLFQLMGFPFVPEDVKIHTGPFANKLTEYYKADALTLNKNIFLSEIYSNLSSPNSLAVIGHELTHINQQYDIENFKKPMTHLRHQRLEKHALQNEQNILNYFNITKPNSVMTHVISNLFQNMPNLMQFTPQSDSKENNLINYNLNYSNNLQSSLEPSNDFNPVYLRPASHSNHITKESFPSPNIQPSPKSTELYHLSTSSSISDIPMLASRDRELNSSTQSSPTQSTSPSPQLDFDLIAKQVYQIIKEKIKTERERRGY